MIMQIKQGCNSHIGRRQNQQDSFGFSDFEDETFISHGGVMAVVCDGMGGLEKGEEASILAVKTILDFYMSKKPNQSIAEILDKAVLLANDKVVEEGIDIGAPGNVGTTLAIIVIHEQNLFWRTVGDSRIYLQRDMKLKQLNVDHTYGNELVQKGFPHEEAFQHPDCNALVSFIGVGDTIQIDRNTSSISLKINDVILLCTDGVYNSLSTEEISDILLIPDAMKTAKELQNKALDKQFLHQDNLTSIVLRIESNSYASNKFFSCKVRPPYIISLVFTIILYLSNAVYLGGINIDVTKLPSLFFWK